MEPVCGLYDFLFHGVFLLNDYKWHAICGLFFFGFFFLCFLCFFSLFFSFGWCFYCFLGFWSFVSGRLGFVLWNVCGEAVDDFCHLALHCFALIWSQFVEFFGHF